MRCSAAAIVSTGPIEHRWLAREGPHEAPRGLKLLDRVREALRVRHYSRRTEKAYVGWIRRYILFHCKRHPREMGPEEVTQFLTGFRNGAGWVELPGALGRKYPSAGRELAWQWVLPATRHYVRPETRQRRRHHLHETVVQRAVRPSSRSEVWPLRSEAST